MDKKLFETSAEPEPLVLPNPMISITGSGQKGYIVEIIEVDDVYEAWISHEDYGAKSLMFGLLKKDVSYENALVIVEGNLKTYIDIYKDEFED